jgi:hypothetical protein
MAEIDVTVNIDIADYIEEISTADLMRELRHRNISIENEIFYNMNDSQKINLLKSMFGLVERHSKECLLEEIKWLLKLD